VFASKYEPRLPVVRLRVWLPSLVLLWLLCSLNAWRLDPSAESVNTVVSICIDLNHIVCLEPLTHLDPLDRGAYTIHTTAGAHVAAVRLYHHPRCIVVWSDDCSRFPRHKRQHCSKGAML
jgi:hypothetical protein